MGFPCGSAGKESAHNAGDLILIPGLGRFPGKGKGYPLQCSGLEKSIDCIVHGVTKSWLSDFHFQSWESQNYRMGVVNTPRPQQSQLHPCLPSLIPPWLPPSITCSSKAAPAECEGLTLVLLILSMARNQTGRTLCSNLPLCFLCHVSLGFPGTLGVKNPCANVGNLRDVGLIPGSGRTPGEGNENPLQYSCLDDSTDRDAWRATIHGISQSQTWLSDLAFSSCLRAWASLYLVLDELERN